MPDNTPDPQDSWGIDERELGAHRGFNFDGTVIESTFTTDVNYRDGQALLLRLSAAVDEVYAEDEDEQVWPLDGGQEPVHPSELVGQTAVIDIPVGPGWVTEDDGKSAVNERGGTKFHASSLLGRIVGNVIGDLDGFGDPKTTVTSVNHEDEVDLGGAFDALKAKGQATEAGVWTGFRFGFRRWLLDYGTNRKTQEKMLTERMLPTTFLGEAEGQKPKKAAKKTAKASGADKVAAAKAKKDAEAEAAEPKGDVSSWESIAAEYGLEVEEETVEAIFAGASTVDDHGEFLELMVDIPEVVEDSPLIEALGEEAVFDQIKELVSA